MRRHHAEFVGRRLQLAVAALFARRAEVVALDEQHLQQRAPLGIELLGIALDHLPAVACVVQEAICRPFTLTSAACKSHAA